MRMAMQLFSFKRLVRTLEQTTMPESAVLSLEKQETAKAVGRAIGRAAGHTPWKSSCLVQSLSAWKMLQKRRIAGGFYLGASKTGGEGPGTRAHAWTRSGTDVITGETGHEAFTVITGYRWRSTEQDRVQNS